MFTDVCSPSTNEPIDFFTITLCDGGGPGLAVIRIQCDHISSGLFL